MFTRGAFYRHKSTLDTDIYVVKVQYRGTNYIKMKVNFVDRKHTGIFQLNYHAKVLRKDFHLWQRVL